MPKQAFKPQPRQRIPPELRRVRVNYTLAPETLERMQELVFKRRCRSISALIDTLVAEAVARPARRRRT